LTLLGATQAASGPEASPPVLHDALYKAGVGVEAAWNDLIAEHKGSIAMEVGMHRAVQCLQAATAGLQAHCVEPSPTSFARVQDGVSKVVKEVQDRVTLYQVAAGATQGTVEFTSTGGTGDHVGAHDMWSMEKTSTDARVTIVQVPSMPLDDIVKDKQVYMLKVDTQGFEPSVFAGLKKSLANLQIDYILTEFWPRGMDLLSESSHCEKGIELLEALHHAGYTLYATGVQAHPKAPSGWKSHLSSRPFDSIEAHCRWYLDLETKVVDADYRMGYWSDIVAVSPRAPRLGTSTLLGKALQAVVDQ